MNYNEQVKDERRKRKVKYFDEDNYLGKEVEVYYNVHLDMLSVRCAKNKRVLGHAHQMYLRSTSFVVQPGGRDRVRRENKKNVHAWVRGTIAPLWEGRGYSDQRSWLLNQGTCQEIDRTTLTYNPYKHDSFVAKELGTPTYKAKDAIVCASGIVEACLEGGNND